MLLNKKLLSFCLLLSFLAPSTFAATKRVIDQGMLDGQRRYIIACDNGKQMYFIKKFTAPEQVNEDKTDILERREPTSPAGSKPIEFIQSCIQTQDSRGDFCRNDADWSARDAGAEFCQ